MSFPALVCLIAWRRPLPMSMRKFKAASLPMMPTVSKEIQSFYANLLTAILRTVTGFSHMHDSGTGGVSRSSKSVRTRHQNINNGAAACRAHPWATFLSLHKLDVPTIS